MNKLIKFFTLLTVLFLFSAAQAQTTISQTKTFTGNPGYTKNFTFNEFDNTLGLLTSIQIILDMNTAGGYLVVDNDGATSAAVTVKLGADGNVSSSDVPLLNAAFQPVLGNDGVEVTTGDSFTLAADNGDGSENVDATAPDGATHSGGVDNQSKNGFIGSGVFAQYYGTSTYNIAMKANSIIDFGGIGGVEGSFGTPTVGGTLTIIYTYTPFSSDLKLTKSVNDNTPELGDDIIFTIIATNDGPDAAAGVQVEDNLPTGLTYKSDDGSGSYNNSTGIWTIGALANGASSTLHITATVSGTGSITNIAQVHASSNDDPDSTPDNDIPSEDDQDSAGITVPSKVDLELDKSMLPLSPNYGDNVTFTIKVTNTSVHDNATGVTVTDALPAGMTYISSNGDGSYNSSTGIWTVGTVNRNNGIKTLNIIASIDQSGAFVNFAEVRTCNEDDIDSTPGNGENAEDDNDKVNFTISPAADIEVIKTVNNSTPDVGTNIIYTIVVKNNGPDNATGVQVDDHLPAGLTWVSDDASGAYNKTSGIWTVGNLANGASRTLHITATVNVTSLITNTATGSGDQYDPVPDNNDDDEDIDPPTVFDLELDKSVNDATPNFKDEIVYTLTVTNTSTHDNATGVRIRDILPATLSYISQNGDGTYNSSTGIWSPGTVNANGGSRTINIRVRVDGTGTIENFAEVSQDNGDDADSTPDNGDIGEDDDDKVSITVAQSADLRLTKTADDTSPKLNNDVTFTITVHNDGPDNTTGVIVEDILPAGLTYKSDNSSGAYAVGTGLWTIGNLANGASVSLQIVATATQSGTVINTAQVNSSDLYDPDSTPDNDTPAEDDQDDVTIIVPETVDLRLEKTVDNATPNFGDNVIFTITVNNDGPDAASGIEVTDILPAGVSWVSDNGSGNFNNSNGLWTIGNLANGGSVSLQITAKIQATGTITNMAQVSACDDDDVDSTPGNNISSEDDQDDAVLTVAPSADLRLSKTVDQSNPHLNDYINFTITLNNDGPDGATNVSVEDILPAGVTYDSNNPSQGTYNSGTGIWTIGSVANGGSATLGIRAKVTTTGSFDNSAQVHASDQYDPDSTPDNDTPAEDDQDSATFASPLTSDLSLIKIVDNSTPNFGEDIVYTIQITNNGPDNATNVDVEDILPANMTYKSDNSGGDYNTSTGIWTVGSLANGASTSIAITATVNGTGTITNIAQVHASDQDDLDSTPDNDVSSEDDQDDALITVPPIVDLELNKTVNNNSPAYRENITYALTLTNRSIHDNATGVQVSDILPAGLTFVSASGDGSYNESTGIWNVGTVNSNNGSANLNIIVSADQTGSHENFAQVSSCNEDDLDSTPNNGDIGEDDDDKISITVARAADLSLTKNVDNSSPNYGENVTFTITVNNDGPDAASGVKVEDILPTGLSYVSDNSSGSYNSTNGIWTVGNIANGGNSQIQIIAKVNGTGTINNIAQVNSCDQNDVDSTPDNDLPAEDDQDAASVTVPSVVDLELSKTVDNPTPQFGHIVVYTLQVKNVSTFDNATGVQVKDVLPAGLSYISSTGDGSYNSTTKIWSVGTVAANNGTASITLTTSVTGTGTITNFAEVWACDQFDIDSTPANGAQNEDDDAEVSISVPLAADLSLTKQVDSPSTELGQNVVFTLKVKNDGPNAATNVTVEDELPAGLTYQSSTPGSYNSSSHIWSIGSLNVGQEVTLLITAKVTKTGVITNSAEIKSSDQYDPDSTPDNNIPSEDDQDRRSVSTQPVVDLELKKTANKDTVNYMDNIIFTITVTNTLDQNNATGVKVKDILPKGFVWVNAAGNGVYTPTNGIWNIGNIAKNGGKAELQITARAERTGSITNFAQVSSCNEADIDSEPDNGDNNEDDDDKVTLFVPAAADLSLEKTVDRETQHVLKDVIFTVNLTNAGPDKGTGITVEDLLPAGLTFKTFTGDGSFDPLSGIWSVSDMDKDDKRQIQITAEIQDTIGVFTNTAQVKTANEYDYDSTPDNNIETEDDQDSAKVTSQPVSDLRLEKTVDKANVEIGQPVVFLIKVTNDGPDDASNVKVEDLLPTGFTYVSHNHGSYNPVTGIWNIGALTVNSDISLQIKATGDRAGSFINIAQINSSDHFDPDSEPDNDKPLEDDQDSVSVYITSGTIGDLVWLDNNSNAIKDKTEYGLPGIKVRLFQNSNLIATDTTDSNGLYIFANLAAGKYTVKINQSDLEEGLHLTTANQPLEINLASGQIYLDADFGYSASGGSIGDEVWIDLNLNGTRDSNETTGLKNVSIYLKDQNGGLIKKTVTDKDGIYHFTSLPADTYLVELDRTTIPPGYSLTTREKHQVILADKENFDKADFGLALLLGNVGSIGDYIWKDLDRDGIHDPDELENFSGVEVLLLDGNGNKLKADTTDSDGTYMFQNLPAGNYIVDVNRKALPFDYILTTDNDPLYIKLAAGQDYKDADFGYMKIAGDVGVIGDYTWHDENWNTFQDRSEESLSWIYVYLFQAGKKINEMRTDHFGGYRFVNLPPGNYEVKAYSRGPQPPNMSLSKTSAASRERWEMTTIDSFFVNLSGGQIYTEADFGFAYPDENWGTGNRKIIARYQAWYTDSKNDSTLRHWDPAYLGGIADTSLFDSYDSADEDAAEYQILSAWAAGIDGFSVDWFGKKSLENAGTKLLLNTADKLFAKYEGNGFDFQIIVSYNEKAIGQLDSNFIYLGDSLMSHPAYWGKRQELRQPVFIFNTEKEIITASEYRTCADTTLPVGKILIWNNADTTVFNAMDVVHPWVQPRDNNWDSQGMIWGENYLDETYDTENEFSRSRLIFALGGVWPGFDDRNWSGGNNHWMSRQDTLVYQQTWNKVHDYHLNPAYSLPMPWCLIESWNDFNNATGIEPSVDRGYSFNTLTRDNARIFKSSLPKAEVGVNNFGLIIPQHIHQARIAAKKRPAMAASINTLTAKARDSFMQREFLTAISYADLAAGVAMQPVTQQRVASQSVKLTWEPVDRATSYLVYISTRAADFNPCSKNSPDIIPIGKVTEYTLDNLAAETIYYVAVTVVDTSLGRFANQGWYENNVTGAGVFQIGEENATDVKTESLHKPVEFNLEQNYPNPFNPETTIRYSLPASQHVQLNIYNINGQVIRTLVNMKQSAGPHTVNFSGMDFPSGVYFYKITTGKFSRTRRMILMK